MFCKTKTLFTRLKCFTHLFIQLLKISFSLITSRGYEIIFQLNFRRVFFTGILIVHPLKTENTEMLNKLTNVQYFRNMNNCYMVVMIQTVLHFEFDIFGSCFGSVNITLYNMNRMQKMAFVHLNRVPTHNMNLNTFKINNKLGNSAYKIKCSLKLNNFSTRN